jgi:hypothetical protein
VGIERLRRCRRAGGSNREALGGVDGPAHQRRTSTCRAIRGRADWAAGRGRAAPRSPTRASRGPPPTVGPCWPGSRSITVRRVAWRQPSCSPRRRLPAVNVMAASVPGRCRPHRPLGPPQPVELRRHRPGAVLQVLQVAVAVERPAVDAAGPAAPVAGLRGARTRVIGSGPAGAPAALADPRSGRDADLPGPARLLAAHQASPPLAWLPGSDQPATRHG